MEEEMVVGMKAEAEEEGTTATAAKQARVWCQETETLLPTALGVRVMAVRVCMLVTRVMGARELLLLVLFLTTDALKPTPIMQPPIC